MTNGTTLRNAETRIRDHVTNLRYIDNTDATAVMNWHNELNRLQGIARGEGEFGKVELLPPVKEKADEALVDVHFIVQDKFSRDAKKVIRHTLGLEYIPNARRTQYASIVTLALYHTTWELAQKVAQRYPEFIMGVKLHSDPLVLQSPIISKKGSEGVPEFTTEVPEDEDVEEDTVAEELQLDEEMEDLLN